MNTHARTDAHTICVPSRSVAKHVSASYIVSSSAKLNTPCVSSSNRGGTSGYCNAVTRISFQKIRASVIPSARMHFFYMLTCACIRLKDGCCCAAVQESLRRDRPSGLTSPAFHTCGSENPFRAYFFTVAKPRRVITHTNLRGQTCCQGDASLLVCISQHAAVQPKHTG
jgi:hypothetical protein